ncbi:MAG: hypothetical protein AB7N76_33115 [Planctomycetota bacterium]
MVRVGLLVPPRELVRLEDLAVLGPWMLDCVRRVLPLGSAHLAPYIDLVERSLDPATPDPTPELRRQLEVLHAEEGEPHLEPLGTWPGSYHAVADALQVALAARAPVPASPAEQRLKIGLRNNHALTAAFNAAMTAQRAAGVDELPWQAQRLLERLLGVAGAFEPLAPD